MNSSDETACRGLRSDLGRRLALCSRLELVVVDELLLALERDREGTESTALDETANTAARLLRALVAVKERA